MRRDFLGVRFLMTALVSLTICLMLNVLPISAQEEVALLIMVNGTVQWRTNSSAKWQSASKNLRLYHGNDLKTGPLSKAAIVFRADGRRVLVNEKTQLTVETKGAGLQKTNRVMMVGGEIYTKLKLKGQKFEVETPASVASVKGSEGDIQYDENTETTILTVFEAFWEHYNELGSVDVGPGHQSTARKRARPFPPEPLSQDELNKRKDWAGKADPQWQLDLGPTEGSRDPSLQFFSLKAISIKTGRLDPDFKEEIAITSGAPALQLSLDGTTWASSITLKPQRGTGRFRARASTNIETTISATAPQCIPSDLTVSLGPTAPVKKSHIIKLRFQKDKETKEITIEGTEK